MVYYSRLAEVESEKGSAGLARLDRERPHLVGLVDRCAATKAWSHALNLAWALDNYFFNRGAMPPTGV